MTIIPCNNDGINKTTIALSKNYITATDESGEGKIKTSEIKDTAETNQHIFIQFKNGSALIIPKRELNNDLDWK